MADNDLKVIVKSICNVGEAEEEKNDGEGT